MLVAMQNIFPTELCGTDINYINVYIHYVKCAEEIIGDSPR
jgi:hypothetical protein